MTKKQNILLKASIAFAVLFAVAPVSNAMHIMEGYLPANFCIAWGIICLPFIVAGFFSIQKTLKQNRKTLILLAMSGAFVFVISSLKIPSVTGSCSHMTGTGLGAILFGPTAAGVLGLIVLLFQAILLAHGGLTTLGANTFSMAIAGPFVSFGIYKLCQKLKVNRKIAVFLAAFLGDLFTYCVTSLQLAMAYPGPFVSFGIYKLCQKLKVNRKIAVFLAAFLGDLFTYCVTSLQLAMAYPSEAGGMGASAVKFLGVFAPTQLPLAVMEGLLTVVIVIALESYAKPELKAVGFLKEGKCDGGRNSWRIRTVVYSGSGRLSWKRNSGRSRVPVILCTDRNRCRDHCLLYGTAGRTKEVAE